MFDCIVFIAFDDFKKFQKAYELEIPALNDEAKKIIDRACGGSF